MIRTTHALGLDQYLYNRVRDPQIPAQYNYLTHAEQMWRQFRDYDGSVLNYISEQTI